MKGRKYIGLTVTLAVFAAVLSIFTAFTASADSFENEISAFPESYKVYLRQLHEKYPDWKFECVETGLDFYAAVEGENYAPSAKSARSAISSSVNSILKDKSSGFYSVDSTGKETYVSVDAGFVRANKLAISYYMDPRNFLDETSIFQFETLSFSENISVSDVEQILKGTFMYNTKVTYYDSGGNTHKNTFTYGECIYNAGKANNVNPCFLASKIKNEVVLSGGGPSGSVTGKYEGYEGYYNFFNIGAYSGTSPIANGLAYASKSGSYGRPWNTPKKSINGGAQFLAESYISKGQNTGYFQKFNVSPSAVSAVYTHQYMTNISGALSQAKSTYRSYSADGLLSLSRTFLIPVYENMPGASKQTEDFSLFDSYGQKAVTNVKVNVRTAPTLENTSVIYVPDKGTELTILSKCRNTSKSEMQFLYYPYWYYVEFTDNGKTCRGYIVAEYATLSSEIQVNVGDVFTLPVKACGDEKPAVFTWDTSTVSVSSDNTLKALKSGTAYITAYTTGGGYDYIKVKVGKYSASSLKVSDFSMTLLSNSPYFSWGKVSSATGYELTVYEGDNILYTDTLSSGVTSASVPSLIFKSSLSAKVRAYKLSGKSKLSGEFSTVDIKDARLVNIGSIVCKNITKSSYTLSWNNISCASGYQLYRYNSSSGEFELYKTVSKNYCDFKSLGAGSCDKYKVRAYANIGSQVIYSEFSQVFEGYTYTKTMSSPTASLVTEASLTINWQSVQGAKNYAVYRLDTSKNEYVKCGETAENTFTVSSLACGKAYDLRVEAVDNSSGTVNRIAGADFCFSTLPEKVTLLKQTSSTGIKADISWKKLSGASSYMVYLLDSASNTYKLYAKTKTNSCSITSLKVLSTYKVKVCAVVENSGEDFKGEFSSVLTVYTGPKKTASFKATDITETTVSLKWSAVSGASGYKVYRVNLSTGAASLVTTVSTTNYTVKSLKAGSLYKFKIRAYIKVGSAKYNGNASQIISVRTVPDAVGGITSDGHTISKYTLHWERCENADGYIIYRYNSSSKKYEAAAKTQNNQYTVKNLYSAKKDTYKIAAYVTENGREFVGKLSNEFKTTTLPKNASQVTVTKSASGKLNISWKAALRASGYRIYAYNSKTGKWVSLGYTSKNSYTVSASKIKASYTKIKVRSYVKINSKRYYASGKTAKIPS